MNNTWRYSVPTRSDLPIYVSFGDVNDYDIRLFDKEVPAGKVLWVHADIPKLPVNKEQTVIDSRFQELANSDSTTEWFDNDWFAAGFHYAVEVIHNEVQKVSTKKSTKTSPFIDPAIYFKKDI